jgi:hypothetical protein
VGTSSVGRRKHKAAGHPKGPVRPTRERADDTCGATKGSNPLCSFMKNWRWKLNYLKRCFMQPTYKCDHCTGWDWTFREVWWGIERRVCTTCDRRWRE